MTPANENSVRAACRRCTEEIQQAMRKKPSLTGTKQCLPSSTSITRKLKLWELASWSSSSKLAALMGGLEPNNDNKIPRVAKPALFIAGVHLQPN